MFLRLAKNNQRVDVDVVDLQVAKISNAIVRLWRRSGNACEFRSRETAFAEKYRRKIVNKQQFEVDATCVRTIWHIGRACMCTVCASASFRVHTKIDTMRTCVLACTQKRRWRWPLNEKKIFDLNTTVSICDLFLFFSFLCFHLRSSHIQVTFVATVDCRLFCPVEKHSILFLQSFLPTFYSRCVCESCKSLENIAINMDVSGAAAAPRPASRILFFFRSLHSLALDTDQPNRIRGSPQSHIRLRHSRALCHLFDIYVCNRRLLSLAFRIEIATQKLSTMQHVFARPFKSKQTNIGKSSTKWEQGKSRPPFSVRSVCVCSDTRFSTPSSAYVSAHSFRFAPLEFHFSTFTVLLPLQVKFNTQLDRFRGITWQRTMGMTLNSVSTVARWLLLFWYRRFYGYVYVLMHSIFTLDHCVVAFAFLLLLLAIALECAVRMFLVVAEHVGPEGRRTIANVHIVDVHRCRWFDSPILIKRDWPKCDCQFTQLIGSGFFFLYSASLFCRCVRLNYNRSMISLTEIAISWLGFELDENWPFIDIELGSSWVCTLAFCHFAVCALAISGAWFWAKIPTYNDLFASTGTLLLATKQELTSLFASAAKHSTNTNWHLSVPGVECVQTSAGGRRWAFYEQFSRFLLHFPNGN